MTQWALTGRTAATQLGADLVFLDLDHDQYSCLRGQPGLSLEGRQLITQTIEPIQPLIDAGLVSVRPVPSESDDRLAPMRPASDLDVQLASALHPSETRDFLACWVEALTRFPGRSLLSLHKQVRRRDPMAIHADLDRVKRRVAVFQALLPWLPFPGACLFKSYLLLRFLQRDGSDARWVIGVRTWPFEAHCWLQLDDIALDDRCERLVRFQPLLAI